MANRDTFIRDGVLMEYIGSDKHVVIPDSVTSINYYAFSDCSDLTSVTIPESVTSIGWGAFSGCSDLTSVTIPDSVTSIGKNAFNGCEKLVQVENGVSYVDKWVIACDPSVTSVSLRNDTVGIADNAFYECMNITSITIPDSVTNIGYEAFKGCSGLENITIPDSVTSIGSFAFDGCSGLENITIPESVTSINNFAFNGCEKLMQVENGVSYVDKWVIACDPSVTSVSLRNDTIGIADFAFDNCRSLESVAIPDSVTSIGFDAFYGCMNITSITIPDSVTTIGNYAFADCEKLTSIQIPEHCINENLSYAFPQCNNLSQVIVGDNVINISSIEDLNNLQAMVEDLRYNDFITNNNVLEEYWGTNKIVCIPEKINIIGDHAFANNDNLTVVNIPSNVQYVEATAFDNCKNLEQIIAPEHLHETLQKNNPNVEILSEPAIYKLSDLVEEGRAFIVNDNLISINENVYGKLVIDEHISGIESGVLKNSNITAVEADEKLEKLIACEGKTFIERDENDRSNDFDKNNDSNFVMD